MLEMSVKREYEKISLEDFYVRIKHWISIVIYFEIFAIILLRHLCFVPAWKLFLGIIFDIHWTRFQEIISERVAKEVVDQQKRISCSLATAVRYHVAASFDDYDYCYISLFYILFCVPSY